MAGTTFNPDEVWKPFGAFSMVAVQGAGQVVHLKGQVALDVDGNLVGADDMAVQVEQCLRNIETVLASLGGRMQDVYALVHYATDIEAFMQTGEVRTKYFQPPFPVTTTVEVSRLYRVDLLVEITASAEIPLDRYRGISAEN